MSPCRSTIRLARVLLIAAPLMPGCQATLPSAGVSNGVRLPIPTAPTRLPGPERLSRIKAGETIRITPLVLIPLAFNQQPDIKSSYQRFKEEEARYDFFVASRDSLTPRVRALNRYSEARDLEDVQRDRSHTVELAIEKRFFDTTELNVAVGLTTEADNEAIGYRPTLSADLRYPLWVSRQKLERTSEEIFRRNELNDAQLGYIETVRGRLQRVLFSYYNVIGQREDIQHYEQWQQDLQRLLDEVNDIRGRDVTTDRSRIEAELARVSAQVRERAGRLEIDIERLKATSGIPFTTKIELVDEPFNPFEGATHEELLQVSIDTDPEIATLRNEERNAEVQLDLARRGTWDVALLLDGQSNLEGAGEDNGLSDWSVGFGLDISVVDPRVTSSLSRQAEANIQRFSQAIISRENAIFVDTLEPIVRIRTLSASKKELIENLPRFEQDFQTGLEGFRGGTLNIDDLLKRRENLIFQQREITRLTRIIGANVSELCSATGRFFELLEAEEGG